LLAEEAAPPGLLEAAAPPELPVLLAEEPPAPELLVPPVPPGLELADESGVLDEAELEELGSGAVAVVDEEEDEPPGTTIVSFSFVTLETGGLPPGITVVVSLRSHAERASAPAKINR
jgi:hypothetical protein